MAIPNWPTPPPQTAFNGLRWDALEVGPNSQQTPHSQAKSYTNREPRNGHWPSTHGESQAVAPVGELGGGSWVSPSLQNLRLDHRRLNSSGYHRPGLVKWVGGRGLT